MPIFMDVHILPGVTAKDVAEAHRLDMIIQHEHGCKCMTYWIDEQRENVFCLIEAPAKESVEQMHAKAHGLVPNKIIEVDSSVVESFLGRIFDPPDAQTREDGLKVFADPSFRVLLVTRITDPVLLQYRLGEEKANELLDCHKQTVRRHLKINGGREVEHEGAGFIASFSSAAAAVNCGLNIQKDMSCVNAEMIEFSIGIHAGEPVAQSDRLFGDTIRFAKYMCDIAENFQVVLGSSVKELVAKDHLPKPQNGLLALSPQDENLLDLLFTKLEEHWQDPEFDMAEYCQATIMSKSQLYRKAVAFTGVSPNLLLKNFRLENAKQMMKKKRYNIAQITFDSGFTSPSYFTKCFKKKYGLLPMTYVDLLH